VGKKFVQAHFSEQSKLSVLSIVHRVKNTLLDRLKKLEWMSEETKKHAVKKLENINIKIGHPDKYIDYTKLKIVPGKHFENQLSSNLFMFSNMLLVQLAKQLKVCAAGKTARLVHAVTYVAMRECTRRSRLV